MIGCEVGLLTTKGTLGLVGLYTVSSRESSPSRARVALVLNSVGVRRSGSSPIIFGSSTARSPGFIVMASSNLSLAGVWSERTTGSSVSPSGEATRKTLRSAS